MKTLTVFTPAYNRAHTLKRTYQSLCDQTCKDFEWLIVDDGSTDNTRAIVDDWINERVIPIRYIYQSNQGMHGAHNTAYANIESELNTCVDSDDYMPEDAVEKIIGFWKSLPEEKKKQYAGLIGLDYADGGELIGTAFPAEMRETTLQGFYEAGGKGDKKLVYRTDIIKNYPEYPIFEGERYVGLAYKYILIDQDYKLLTLNEPLVIVDYQLSGSSFSMYKQYWNNPKGFAFFRKTEMTTTKSLKRKFIVCAHYVSSTIISRNSKFLRESPCKVFTIMAIPLGILLYLRIRFAVNHNRRMNIS